MPWTTEQMIFIVEAYFRQKFIHAAQLQSKNRITSKILFRMTQNFSYIRSSLCSRHLQSFKSVLQKLLVSLASKNVLQIVSPALQAHLDPATLPNSSLGIAFMAAVIAAFRSGILWGLLTYTLSLRYPHR